MNCSHSSTRKEHVMTLDGRSWWTQIVCRRCDRLLKVLDFKRRA